MRYDPNKRNFDLIPMEMKQARRWVCWTADKTPIDVHAACGASSANPATWATFDEACAFIGNKASYTDRTGTRVTKPTQGIGFMLGDGWTGIDLDGGTDHGSEAVPVAILDDFMQLRTYCEYSKSGDGYHLIGRYSGGKLEGTRNGCVEIYTGSRYFAVTGNVYKSACNLGDITGTLPALHDKYIAAPKRKAQQDAAAVPTVAMPSGEWDDYLKDNVRDMLRYLDPSPVNEWISVGICLKSLGFTVDMFDDWSQGGNYGGRNQIERWWKSWTELDPEAGKKLYSMAKRRGWNPPKEGMPKMEAPQISPKKVEAPATIYEADPAVVEASKPVKKGIPTADKPNPDSIRDYIAGSGLVQDINTFMGYKDRKTGFSNLDAKCGGLYPGLYVLGAISSLGKTTFMHAIADNIATAGDTVLYFSLEQSRMEMTLKSLSRMSAKADPRFTKAASAIEMRRGEKRDIMLKAAQDYIACVGDRMNVIECNFGVTADWIIEYVTTFMQLHPGIRPVVFIDYLQIIQQEADTRMQEREKIDRSVQALKKMQSDNDLVVVVISSVNRGNYLMPIDFESFKESGGIEYSCDVCWGLQLQVVTNSNTFDDDKKTKQKRDLIRQAKKDIPRKIELVCLKNRYGISNYYAGFKYYPQFDYFEIDPGYLDPDTRSSTPATKRK